MNIRAGDMYTKYCVLSTWYILFPYRYLHHLPLESKQKCKVYNKTNGVTVNSHKLWNSHEYSQTTIMKLVLPLFVMLT